MYRADAESKFRRPTQARKEHDAHVSKRARLADRQVQSMLEGGGDEPQPRRVVDGSFDSVLRVAIADHFRVVCNSWIRHHVHFEHGTFFNWSLASAEQS